MKFMGFGEAFLVIPESASKEDKERNQRLFDAMENGEVLTDVKAYEDSKELRDSERLVHVMRTKDGEEVLIAAVPAEATNFSFGWAQRDDFIDRRLQETWASLGKNPKAGPGLSNIERYAQQHRSPTHEQGNGLDR